MATLLILISFSLLLYYRMVVYLKNKEIEQEKRLKELDQQLKEKQLKKLEQEKQIKKLELKKQLKEIEQEKREKEGYYDEATGIHYLPKNWHLEPEYIGVENHIREQIKKNKIKDNINKRRI